MSARGGAEKMTTDGALIGAALRRQRIRLRLTVPDVAMRAGIAKSALWNLEEGNIANPTIGTVRNVCDALGYPVEALVRTWTHALRGGTPE